MEHRHSRGYLPHFDAAGFTQFITFRLADSLPVSIFRDLDHKRRNKLIDDQEYFHQIEHALHLGHGTIVLKEPAIARIVADSILDLARTRYELHAWVVMVNHVSLLLSPREGQTVTGIMHSLKGYTATRANKVLGRTGRFWSPD